MKSVVVVSHSSKFAEGTVEIIKAMAPELNIVAAGGNDDGGLGTSYEKIRSAIESVYSEDGVLIFTDLGSSVITTEMIIEELSSEGKDKIELSDIQMMQGVLETAMSLYEKTSSDNGSNSQCSFTHIIKSEIGLHARPASDLIRLVKEFKSDIRITANGKSTSGKSLIELLTLGAVKGTEVSFTATGEDAKEAIETIKNYAEKTL